MKTKTLETEDAGPYRAAAYKDARMKSLAEESTYSQAQRNAAIRMSDALHTVYSCDDIHINYRKKFISVKVAGGYAMDTKNLKFLEDGWEKSGVTKHSTSQGIIYRIPKI